MLRTKIKKTASIAFLLSIIAGADAADMLFSPAPYREMLNSKVLENYDYIRQHKIDPAASTGHKLKKGTHRLTLRGREPGSRLARIWVGKFGESPEKDSGQYIDLSSARITAPMDIKNEVLIGGDKEGTAEFSFKLEADDTYAFWGEACGPDAASNSFFVSIDGNPEITWDIPTSKSLKPVWQEMKGRGLDYFSAWILPMSWGACSPHSALKNNAEFRKLALDLLKISIDGIGKRKVQPAQLWFLEDLEALRLWQLDLRSPQENKEFATMQKKMRVFVENCYNMTQTPNGWRENTPNIQIQAAAILTLAAELWKNTDPEASKKWNNEAQKCLDRAWKWKLENGPFVYSYGSGVDADYFSHDARHLACIYRITGDARVAEALRDMAIIVQSITSWGQIISISSPWWKHTYNRHNKGERMLSGHILKLSGDPLYARMIQLDIERNANKPYSGMQRDWLIAYYNGDLDEFKNQVATIKNTTGMSTTENGPILRNDGFNVAMPWRSWCESTAGAVFATPDAIESQLCSIIITAIEPNVEHARARAHYPLAYSVVEMSNPVPQARDMVIDKDFIAGATSFRPALAGPALPEFVNKKNDSPWLRTDIWFANADGMAGVLELQALKDNSCTRVALWTHISEKAQINGASISVKGMTVVLDEQFSGKIHNLGKTWGYSAGYYPLDLLEYVFKESANGFKQGETFSTVVSVKRDGGATLTVGTYGTDGAIRHAQILRNGKDYVKLIFNSGKTTTTYNGMEIKSGKLKVLKLK